MALGQEYDARLYVVHERLWFCDMLVAREALQLPATIVGYRRAKCSRNLWLGIRLFIF